MRARLAAMLGTRGFYDLDRLDLSVESTLDVDAQKLLSERVDRFSDPEVAAAAGLVGMRLLDPGSTDGVKFSLNVYERGVDAHRLRAQVDNSEGALDLSDGVKLDLGSTAKLRTLVTYLELIAQVYDRLAALPVAERAALALPRSDRLGRWVQEELVAHPKASLAQVLDASLERRYSASPYAVFFTGGGEHRFSNFDKADNERRPSVREAFQRSVNLVFVRLMRDVVDHVTASQLDSDAILSAPSDDSRRRAYLWLFAHSEGSVFLAQAYSRFAALEPDRALARLYANRRPSPKAVSAAIRATDPHADFEQFSARLAALLPEAQLADDLVAKLYAQSDPARWSLQDRGYLAKVHPLELWLLAHLREHPRATLAEVLDASRGERLDSYRWLFRSGHRGAQNRRIRTLLEREAFRRIHAQWQATGYPFPSLVPSLATALGTSADRPTALAELMGIIASDGVRVPLRRIEAMRFAADTPYETHVAPTPSGPDRVLRPEVCAVLQRALVSTVEGGTAARARGALRHADGSPATVGGKTGTGDHRYKVMARGQRVLEERHVSRSATFVFLIDDRFFGVLTAVVTGPEAGRYHFTSSLPVQIFTALMPEVLPVLETSAASDAPQVRAGARSEIGAVVVFDGGVELRRDVVAELHPLRGHRAERDLQALRPALRLPELAADERLRAVVEALLDADPDREHRGLAARGEPREQIGIGGERRGPVHAHGLGRAREHEDHADARVREDVLEPVDELVARAIRDHERALVLDQAEARLVALRRRVEAPLRVARREHEERRALDVLARLVGDHVLVLQTEPGNRVADDPAQRVEVFDRVGVAHAFLRRARRAGSEAIPPAATLAGSDRYPTLRAPRLEPERAVDALDAHLAKSRALEPTSERVRIHEHHRVAPVREPEQRAHQAVRPDQPRTRREHARHLGEQAILERRRRHVVQHRARHGAREAPGRERQVGGVGFHHLDAGARAARERRRERGVLLDAGELGNALGEHVGGEPGSGAHLEHVGAEVDPREHPGQQALAHGAAPGGGSTIPAVEGVHAAILGDREATFFAYSDNRCLKTDNRHRLRRSCPTCSPGRSRASRRTTRPATRSRSTSTRSRSSLYASSGVMTVTTEHGTWVVPPERAVWVPARVGHSIRMTGRVSMRTIYLSDALGPLAGERVLRRAGLAAAARVASCARWGSRSPIREDGGRGAPGRGDRRRDPRRADRAAAPAAAARPARAPRRGCAARESRRSAHAQPTGRASPARPRARSSACSSARPRSRSRRGGSRRACCAGSSSSRRESPVTSVALDLGYETPSAFIAMFRRALGTSPGRYFRARS